MTNREKSFQVASTDRSTECRKASKKIERRPVVGRGNAMDADGAELVNLANLGRIRCPVVEWMDVFRLI